MADKPLGGLTLGSQRQARPVLGRRSAARATGGQLFLKAMMDEPGQIRGAAWRDIFHQLLEAGVPS